MRKKVKHYLISKLTDLEYIGDLRIEDGNYIFNTRAIDSKVASFENTIFEVVEVDFSADYGCYIKLKTSVSLVQLAVSKL